MGLKGPVCEMHKCDFGGIRVTPRRRCWETRLVAALASFLHSAGAGAKPDWACWASTRTDASLKATNVDEAKLIMLFILE